MELYLPMVKLVLERLSLWWCIWSGRIHSIDTDTIYSSQGSDIDDPEMKGLIPRITEQIFQSIVESDAHLEYLVKVSYMEIYLERIRDLLARTSSYLGFYVARHLNDMD